MIARGAGEADSRAMGCVVAGTVGRAVAIPAPPGYLALEELPRPFGFGVVDGDFYGGLRVATGERSVVVPAVWTRADQLDLVYLFDTVARFTGRSVFEGAHVVPGGEVALRVRIDRSARAAARCTVVVVGVDSPTSRPAVLALDSYAVGRAAWDLVEFLPGVTDADMDWPTLPSAAYDILGDPFRAWQASVQRPYDDELEPPRFPVQALAGHLYRGDGADDLLAFVEEQLRVLHVQPDRERELRLVETLVARRDASRGARV